MSLEIIAFTCEERLVLAEVELPDVCILRSMSLRPISARRNHINMRKTLFKM